MQIDWRGNRRSALHDFMRCITLLAQPFQQRIAAERYAGGVSGAARVLRPHPAQHPVDFTAVAGVVGARQPVEFAAAAAEMHHHALPAALHNGMHQCARVMAARAAFESVKQHQQRALPILNPQS